LPIFILLTSVITLFIASIPTQAVTSDTLNFQGRLMTDTGALVPDGSYNIEFKIYDDPSVGTNWWTENRTGGNAVTVQNGYFSVYLGDVTPFGGTIPWDQELYLTMNVNADGEMTPRFKLTAVPYAFRAGALVDSGGNAKTADDLIQKSPSTIQAVNSALAAIRLNQAGAGGFIQFQNSGTDVFTINNNGGATLGSNTQAGQITLNDGSSNTTTLRAGDSSVDLTFTLPTTAGVLDQCLKTDGTGVLSFGDCAAGGGGGGAVGTTVVKTANETVTNNITPQNDDHLFFPVGANETWAFRFTLYANVNATPDIRFAVTAPAGATCVVNFIDAEGATSNGNYGCGVTSASVPGNTANDVYEVVGTVVNGANAGNVQLQWAQNASNAAAVTVLSGSSLFATSEGSADSVFKQGGNSFSGTAILGTNDANGLNIVTNGITRASVSASGDLSIINSTTVGTGLTVTSGGLTVSAGGANLTGGVDNNSGGITEVGALSGVSSVTSDSGLTIQSAGGGDITLDSSSGVIGLVASTLRRTSAGTTTIDLLDNSGGTTLSIVNSDGTQVAGLNVEGSVTANGFSGSGSGLTSLDGSNISTGSIADARLSSNVVLLDQSQTFTGLPTFSSGLILGNSTSTTSGSIRWSGTDFEGYDGIQWVSLTSGGGGGGSGPLSVAFIQAYDNTGGTDLNTVTPTAVPWDTETKKDTGFTHDNAVDNSRIYLDDAGWYKVSYNVSGINQSTNRNTVFCQVRLNGTTFNSPSGSYSYTRDTTNAEATNTASVYIETTSTNEYYEVLCSQAGTAGAQLAEAGRSWTVAEKVTTPSGGGGLSFEQGGNDFGANGIIGTTTNYDLNLITNNSTALSLTTTNQAIFSGEILANGGLTIGNASGDGLTIVSDSVTVSNGLNFDGNTFVIDSANNRVGIGTATTNNLLTINDASTADSSAQVLLATGVNTNKGLVIQGEASQSANLLEFQNDSGVVLGGFDSSGGLVLGLSTITSSASGSQTVSFGDESGTVCLSGSTNCGFLPLATGTFVTDATTNNTIAINKTGASGNLLALQKNGGAVFTVANTGALQIQSTDSAALDIRNVGGTSYFSVDTSTGQVQVGSSTADAVGVLFVLDTKNTAGDPTGTDGSIYYNSNTGKFRCYEDSTWKDCIGARQVRSFIDTTADAVADNNTTNYWDIAVENNNSVPNLSPSSINKAITGSVSFETQSATTADRSVVARVERSIGTPAACNSGTPVGTILSTFTTNNGEQASNTMIFLDTPNTTSTVYYTLCADTATNNAGSMTVNRIRITLEEANNSN
jgi:hypothetical protein